MVLRLDPRFPHVWRSPRELQIGLDEAMIRLTDPTVAEERMIAALSAGATRPMLESLAVAGRAPRTAVDELLTKLGAVLVDDTSAVAPGSGRASTVAPGSGRPPRGGATPIAVDGEGITADAIRRLFAELAERESDRPGLARPRAGEDAGPAAPDDGGTGRAARGAVAAAVILGHFAIAPARYGHWLRWDVPHLPVVFSDLSIRVGPMIRPGDGPCLFCLDLERTDRDADWPAMASQLVGRRAATEDLLNSAAVVALVGRMIWNQGRTPAGGYPRVPTDAPLPSDARVPSGASAGGHDRTSWSYRLDARTGSLTRQPHRPHPDCACRALPGIATEPGRASDPIRPTSSAGDAVALA